MMSLTHMATRSIPIVSCVPVAKAILSFVPTPSVPLTRTGSSTSEGTRQSPAKPPTSLTTSAIRVIFASGLIRSTSSSPASMSTPASRYVMPIRHGHSRVGSRSSTGAGPDIPAHLGRDGNLPPLGLREREPAPAASAPVSQARAGGVSGRREPLDLEEAVDEDRGSAVRVGAVGELGASVGPPAVDGAVGEERAAVRPPDRDVARRDGEIDDVDRCGAVGE